MDLQADRSVEGLGGLRPGLGGTPSARSRWRFLRTLLIGALCFLSLTCSVAWASTSYVYDANGRLVAVTADDGANARYVYDEMGNIVSVDHVAAGDLAIFAFSPAHGAVGTTVTIYGQGFSSTLSDNTVTFNGVAATVQSATPTQLITAVPDGADTGPISVTVSGRTATSSSPFVVDDTGLPPQITGVTPLLASVGDTLTVAGAHLQPTLGGTSVRLGGRPVAVSTISNTQIQFAVPDVAASGYVTVDTPYGSATSPAPVVVLPSGIAIGDVASEGYALTGGPVVSLNIPAANGVGAVLFDASTGAWLSLQASDISTTASHLNYKIYAPGNVLIASGTLSATAPTIHLPRLTVGGTYLAVVQPDTAGAQLKLAVESNQLLLPDQPLNVTTLVAGQSKRVLFQAAKGSRMAFAVFGTTTAPANHGVVYTIYTPTGQSYTNATISKVGSINLNDLPYGGIYQVVIAPGSGVTGTMQVAAVSAVGGDVPVNGAPQGYTANASGQNIYLTFDTGSQDRRDLELTLQNVSVPGGQYSEFQVHVYNAVGTSVTSFWCYATNPGASCTAHLWYLPGGKYSVVATPNYGGVIHFDALLQEDQLGPNVGANGTASIALSAGQVERLTFNATAGDTIALQVSGVTTTPSGQGVTFKVYRPDAGAITTGTGTYSNFDPTGSQLVNLSNLPVSGTYTVIVAPDYGLPANAQFSVVSGATGTVSTDGSSQSYTANVAKQNIYLTFDTGTTSQERKDLELVLRNVSLDGASNQEFQVHVYNAAGAEVTWWYCDTSNPGASCNAHLWYLPGGKYSIVAVPYFGGTIHFDALIQEDLVGPNVGANETTSIALSAGQVERLTFNATAGDTIALQVSGVTTTPSGHGVTFKVYRPDAGAITTGTGTYSNFDPTGSQLVNLSNLPVSGTYTVIVAPDYGLPANAQFSVVSGATGTVSTDGSSQSYTANVAKQNIYLTFETGTSSQERKDLELVLRNVSLVGANIQEFQVHVYNAAGAEVTWWYCDTSNPGASCNAHLWYLPGGKYSIVAVPYYGGTIHFDALIQEDLVGPNIGRDGTASIALGAGQVERLTFNETAGDTISLQVSGVTTTPSSHGVTFKVYRPDAGAITTGTGTYSNFDPTSSQLVNLSNLPVSGTYTVIVAPDYGLPANADLLIYHGTHIDPTYGDPTLSSDGTPQSWTASAVGQSVNFSFNANLGDNLELSLSNIDSGSIDVQIYNPSGAKVLDYLCSKGNPGDICRRALWNLRAGTYSVMALPYDGGQIQFTAMVKPDVVGPELQLGVTQPVALGAGDVQRLTFHGDAGGTLALTLANVATVPSNQLVYVDIYRPDTGLIGQSMYTQIYTRSSTVLNLSNLPASGDYTAVVYTVYGEPGNADLTLSPGVTGGVSSAGSSTSTFDADVDGENVYFTFDADLGQNLELTLSNLAIPGASTGGVEIQVYSPNNALVADYTCSQNSPGDSCRRALWNLAAGTYSVVAIPYAGGKIHFTAMVKPDVIGPELQPGVPQAITLDLGDVQRLTFHGEAGGTVALTLSNVSTVPSNQLIYVDVYRPDTGRIGQGLYTSFNTRNSQIINLSNLPASGSYTLVVFTDYGLPGTADLTLSPGVTGEVISDGSEASTFDANVTGQNVYFAFDATAGQNLELTLSNLAILGASTVDFEVQVYNPSNAVVANYYCSKSNPGDSCRRALWNLSAGTYSVVATPYAGGQIHFTATVKPNVMGPELQIGIPQAVTLGTGDVQLLKFHGDSGDSLSIALSDVVTTPSNQTVGVDIYRPDTGLIGQGLYATFNTKTSSKLDLTDLPTTGDYTAVVYTSYGEPSSAVLTLSHP